MARGAGFVRAGRSLIAVAAIESVDTGEIELLRARVVHAGGATTVEGPDAIELMMALKPSALEGRRLRWARRAWAVHNLVGHPAMQVLSWLGLRQLALRIHDATVPRPLSSPAAR